MQAHNNNKYFAQKASKTVDREVKFSV